MAMTDIKDKLGLKTKSDEVDRRLDEAVEASFPASDPVALAQPHDAEELGLRRSMPLTTWVLVGGGLLAVIALIALRR